MAVSVDFHLTLFFQTTPTGYVNENCSIMQFSLRLSRIVFDFTLTQIIRYALLFSVRFFSKYASAVLRWGGSQLPLPNLGLDPNVT